MPTSEHEGLVTLFEQQPSLAAELLAFHGEGKTPAYADAKLESSNLTQLDPAAYHADAVVVLRDAVGRKVLALVVEVQRQEDPAKAFTWMVYVASVAARHRCPADLIVLTLSTSVARWARELPLGVRRLSWSPVVIGPGEIPEITDIEEAKRSPARALLSLFAHHRAPDQTLVIRLSVAAARAGETLTEEDQALYFRMLSRLLGVQGLDAMEAYMEAHEQLPPEFYWRAAREALAKGRQEGRQELLLSMLESRFGPLSASQREAVISADDEAFGLLVERFQGGQGLEAIFEGLPSFVQR